MPSYRVTKKAQSDIREIGLYTQQQWGKEQRRAYLQGMEARFERLADSPLLAAERGEFDPPVRIHPYEKHLIVYTAQEDGILIVRVLHESMDVPAQLSSG
ncbi:type II toxin-antitoxin system RelE/ParE family toxin [Hwanghaeella sp. LZ110]|uniref:type II toxin-antitoxin system RelE/ParE family toxin n=1 Tax=Hwanghaeella sp. LZ110 TaxID=3402810 RepID=UPI003B674031